MRTLFFSPEKLLMKIYFLYIHIKYIYNRPFDDTIGCPFFHCNYCNYCNWSVFSLPTIDAKSHRNNMFTDFRLARSKRILSVMIKFLGY